MRRGSAARRLADGLFSQPVLTSASTREVLGGSKNADGHIEVLVEREIPGAAQAEARNATRRALDV